MSGARAPGADLLLVTGWRWRETARVALAAHEAGFNVHMVAPFGHPLEALDWINVVHRYVILAPGRSLARVLNATSFDLIVPADDLAASIVFSAYSSGRLSARSAAAVRRSLGDPATFAIRYQRAAIAAIAEEEDLPAPRTWAVRSEDALPEILAQAEFPVVLKSDGSFGGGGVIVVRDLDQARQAYQTLARPARLASGLKLLLDEGETDEISRLLLRGARRVSVQEFASGEEATISALAWEGQVLGSVAFRVLRTRGGQGPASVIVPIRHPGMERAAAALAGRLGLSGLFGLDFVLSSDRATAFLLELNPRVAPTAHMSLPWQERPLFHLLAEHVGVESPVSRPPLPVGPIALFPQALVDGVVQTDGLDAYLDIPPVQQVADVCVPGPSSHPLAPVVRGLRRLYAFGRAGL